jgi:hypothetical protein
MVAYYGGGKRELGRRKAPGSGRGKGRRKGLVKGEKGRETQKRY